MSVSGPGGSDVATLAVSIIVDSGIDQQSILVGEDFTVKKDFWQSFTAGTSGDLTSVVGLMAFLKVVMPLSLSGVIAVVVFTFSLTLHEFIYALTFVSSSAHRTVSVGVPTELIRGDVFYWQSLVAAAAIVAIPVAIVYSFLLDRLVAGFTMGAVKG